MRSFWYIVLLLWSAAGYGQVNVYSETDKKEVRLNERVNLYIIVEADGENQIQESKLQLPDLSKFNMIGTSSSSNTFIDKETNTLFKQQVLLVALEAKQTGVCKIGSTLVKFNGKIYKSEPFDIVVKEGAPAEKTLSKSDAVYMDMSVDDKDIFENQPTIAILKVYSTNFSNLSNVRNVNFAQQENLEVRIVNMGKNEIEEENNGKMVSQVVAVAMLIPEKTGMITVKPATAVYTTGSKVSKISSNKVDLNVKSLPKNAPYGFKNTIGKYRTNLNRIAPEENVEINKPLDVQLKVEGIGNIDESRLPRLLSSETYTFYKPRIINRLRNTRQGSKGEVLINYVVIPKVPGNITINSETFSFFNPSLNKYVELEGEELRLNVKTPEQIAAAKTTMERVNEYSNDVLETVNNSVVPTQKLKIQPKQSLNWKTLFTNYTLFGLFLLILGVLGWVYRKNFSKPNRQIMPLGSVQETERIIRENRSFDLAANIEYLKKLANEGDFNKFFKSFEDLNNEAEALIMNKTGKSLKVYTETVLGPRMAEDYRSFQQQFSMEKYAPFHTNEHLNDLIDKAALLYSAIL